MFSFPFIENVSMGGIISGNHSDPGPNSVLIQIVDPCTDFPTPKYKFSQVHQFVFLDTENEEDFAISDLQAQSISQILKQSLANRSNVIVHCHAGLCRSGAVAEVGCMLGFAESPVVRIPNLLVKHKIMRALGWTYDSDEQSSINGKPVRYTQGGIIFISD